MKTAVHDHTALMAGDLDSDLSTSDPAGIASAQVISLCELDQKDSGEAAALLANQNPLLQIRTRVQVCVGSVELTVAALLGAKENQIVQLDRLVDQPVDMLVEGKVIARGQLVAVDERFAIRITELPLALDI